MWGSQQYCPGCSGTNIVKPTVLNLSGTPLDGKTMVRVFPGYYSSFVVTNEPALYALGFNLFGNLGSGSTNQSPQTTFVKT